MAGSASNRFGRRRWRLVDGVAVTHLPIQSQHGFVGLAFIPDL